MIKRILTKYLEPRLYWRKVNFNELTEIYSTLLLRSFAISLFGIFIPIYLYELGFSLTGICYFFVVIFGIRPLQNFVTAHLVARFGPKHVLFLSYITQALGFVLLLLEPSSLAALTVLAFVHSLAMSFFFIAYQVDFSKVKHSTHGGKEIGLANVMIILGSIAGPVIGGLLATFVDPQASIALSMVVMLVAAWPLFRTGEPIRANQKLDFSGFKLRKYWRNSAAYTAHSLDQVGTKAMWPLFIGLFLVSDSPYATLGLLTALGAVAGVAASFFIARLIDDHKASQLFKFSVLGNSFLYVVRVGVQNLTGVALINILNEPSTLGYAMPYTKALYDSVDKMKGYRIVSLTVFESISNLTRAILWFGLLLLSFSFSERDVLSIGLIAVAMLSFCLFLDPSPQLHGRKRT